MPDQTLKSVQEIHSMLANAARLGLIRALAGGPKRVATLAQEIGFSMSNTSQNLNALLRGGLVEFERQAHAREYRLVEPRHPLVVASLALLEG